MFSAEEFTSARQSVCIPPLLGACKRVFSQCPLIELSSIVCHPSYYSPSLPGACCLEVFGGSIWSSCGEKVKPVSWCCAMLVGPLKAWENGCCSCWTIRPWFWVLRKVVVACQTSTTLVAKFVSSLSPRSSSPTADGLRQKTIRPMSHLAPSGTARARTPMLTNVGRLQRGQPLTRSCLPSLSAESARVASEETQTRKQSASEERGRARARAHLSAAALSGQHPLVGEPSFLEQNRVTAATVQRSTATLNEFLAFAQKCRWTS